MSESDSENDDGRAGLQWGNVERAFMQALLHRKCITYDEAKELLVNLCRVEQAHEENADVHRVTALMGDALREVHLDLKTRMDQDTRQRVYVVVNTLDTPFTRRATGLSNAELDLFRYLLEAIFGEDNNVPENKFWIGKDQFIQDMKNSSTSVPQAITTFISDGWMGLHDDRLYPTHRTLAELEKYLEDEFGSGGTNTLKKCENCKAMFTRGIQCRTDDCPVRLHFGCMQNYFDKNASDDCMNCRANIKSDHIQVSVE